MNFNASNSRHPNKLGAKRLPQEVEISSSQNFPPPYNPYNNATAPPIYDPYQPQQSHPAQPYPIQPNPSGIYDPNQQQHYVSQQQDSGFAIPTQYLNNPLVANAAMQYGQQLMGSGKQYVDKEIEKYVPVTRLKYYFAVDNAYVIKKLRLLFFPFTNNDWSVRYATNEPVQPRFEVNAPDLYIPTMAYLTYVLVAGFALGTQDRFAPEVLGIQASSALAWTILEVLLYLLSLYVTSITTSLTTIDMIAFSGYKFVGIIFAVLCSLVFQRLGYYCALIYASFALSFFLVRTLKSKLLSISSHNPADPYAAQQFSQTGHKRRLYLLGSIAGLQPILMWWLSFHLLPTPATIPLST